MAYTIMCIVPEDDDSLERRALVIDPDTLGQYTGLKDINGKKIFEGDIIRYTGGDHPEICVIQYDDHTARFMFRGSAVCDFDNCDSELETEVIGNIYDNPELIEN